MLKTYEDLLYKVEKPGRYIGKELNSCMKEKGTYNVHFGFAFADVYEVGMSHLGSHILYHLINTSEIAYCERVFPPWVDLENLMREAKVPLMTVETRTPIKELDILGFTLQYELSYTNILNMLDLGGIPYRREERNESDPLIIAGGPCAYNPEPMADIFDLFIMGEGEEVLPEVIALYDQTVKKGKTKDEFLLEACKIQGIYVPKFYTVSYKEDGTIKSFEPNRPGVPKTVQKRIVKDLDQAYFPDRFLMPNVDVVHDRAVIEIFRGCTKGCRFCQAGMIYRPIRERSVEKVLEITEKIVSNTGFEELSLSSLSTLDYSNIKELVERMMAHNTADKIGISLPSLRLDSFSVDILEEIQKVRKTGLTFAPEAGSQRLRDVINKGVDKENIKDTMEHIFNRGWNKVKLYFMIGLPTETIEDLNGIEDIANMVTYIHQKTPKENKRDGLQVTVSASCFVPKPFTPFQWMGQDTLETFKEKQTYLKSKILNKKVKFNYHDAETSFLEGVIARGDRRVCDLIIAAYENGCKFDGWHDHFKIDLWMKAFETTHIDPAFYANRKREYDEILPWDFVDVGVDKQYLIEENEKAMNGERTNDCREVCTGCGVNTSILGGSCF